MSLIGKDLWFITPLQAIAAIANGVNTGASGAQSPLVAPLLFREDIPANYASAQMLSLLHESEKFFPPLNALATVSNLATAITSFLYRDTNAAAKAKLPWAAAGFALNVAVTVYTLSVMVPKNNGIKEAARTLQKTPSDETTAKVYRQRLRIWQGWAYGRAAIMLAAAVVGTVALLEDGAAVRIPRL